MVAPLAGPRAPGHVCLGTWGVGGLRRGLGVVPADSPKWSHPGHVLHCEVVELA